MSASLPAGPVPLSPSRKPWEILGVVLVLVVFVAAVVFFGGLLASALAPVWRWLIIAALMLGLLIAIGLGVNRRPDGFLIDTRYKFSLSRLQIVLWTLLVLSAFLTIALPRALPGGMYDLAQLLAEAPQNPSSQATLAQLKALSPGREACFALPETGATVTETAALAEKCTPDPVGISFPLEVVAALGISVASFTGTALIHSIKRGRSVEVKSLQSFRAKQAELLQAQEALQKAEADLAEAQEAVNLAREALDETEEQLEQLQAPAAPPPDPNRLAELEADHDARKEDYHAASEYFKLARQSRDEARALVERLTQEMEEATQVAAAEMEGVLHRNTDPSQASWVDLCRGDEIGNYLLVDISKVQMFFFTIVLVFAYGAAIYLLLQNPTALKNPLGVELPPFSASMNGLLAISHAGYLVVKTVPHTATAGGTAVIEERR